MQLDSEPAGKDHVSVEESIPSLAEHLGLESGKPADLEETKSILSESLELENEERANPEKTTTAETEMQNFIEVSILFHMLTDK